VAINVDRRGVAKSIVPLVATRSAPAVRLLFYGSKDQRTLTVNADLFGKGGALDLCRGAFAKMQATVDYQRARSRLRSECCPQYSLTS
jgi:hypothetical protein